MTKKDFPMRAHLALLGAFSVGMTVFWMLPVWVMGYPHTLPVLYQAKNYPTTVMFSFADSIGRYLSTYHIPSLGVRSAADGRLSAIIEAWLSHVVAFNAVSDWILVSAVIFALGLVGLWLFLEKLFDARIAWISIVLTALMPIYWREATVLHNYDLAFFFLFWSLAAFVRLRDTYPKSALVVSGLLFGASLGAKDVFLIFVPWFGLGYLLYSGQALRRGLVRTAMFFGASAAVYVALYIPDILSIGYPYNQNLARLWPNSQEIANETYLHLYPDPYTYYFDSEWFEQQFMADMEGQSLHRRMMDEKVLLAYGVVDNVFRKVRLGFWLVLNDVPYLFQRHVIGGVFMWLFILPGLAVLWKTRRTLVWQIVGLIVSMEFILRFVLGYERLHMMNVAWIFAACAAVGMTHVAKQMKFKHALVVLLMVSSLQLLQANRYELAELYESSSAPLALAASETIAALPQENTAVAVPTLGGRYIDVATLSDRTVALFRAQTVERLASQGKLANVFDEFGITHVYGYPESVREVIERNAPAVNMLEETEFTVAPRGWVYYLIHLVR